MKKIATFLLVLIMLVLALATASAKETSPRILVAYLSRAGENYHVGETREGSVSSAYAGYIEKGNTAIMAAVIAETTGADLFEIKTVTPYPDEYASMLRVAQEEIDSNARPELTETVESMDEYNVIFIGYPIWHAKMPQAIYSFIENYDLSGKTVIPFNTHEGSGQSGTQQAIENALPDSTVLQGLAILGKTAQEDQENTQAMIDEWLEELGMKKVNSTEDAQVLATYGAIQQAMIDKDIETLDRLYLDGTTFTHMSGKTQTKAEFFGEIADGTLNYFAYDIQHPQITVSGNEATLSASVALTAKVYGASGTWTLPVNAHFSKIEGQWYAHN